MSGCKVQGEFCIHKWEEGELLLSLLPWGQLLLISSSLFAPSFPRHIGAQLDLGVNGCRATGLILLWDSLPHTEKKLATSFLPAPDAH